MSSNYYAALMSRKVITVQQAWQAAVHIKGNPKRIEIQNHTRRAAGRAQGRLQSQAGTFRLT